MAGQDTFGGEDATANDAHEGRDDAVAETLDRVADTASAEAATSQDVAHEARELAAERRAGHRVSDERFAARVRLLLGRLGGSAERLTQAALAIRRTWSHGMRNEGLSVRQIARHFGVSHQRVSALLRHQLAQERLPHDEGPAALS